MDESYAPTSPQGWDLTEYFYDGRLPRTMLAGRSLAHCKQTRTAWQASPTFNDGKSELVIAPAAGWESIKGDPCLALAWAIAERLVSVELGAEQMRGVWERSTELTIDTAPKIDYT